MLRTRSLGTAGELRFFRGILPIPQNLALKGDTATWPGELRNLRVPYIQLPFVKGKAQSMIITILPA